MKLDDIVSVLHRKKPRTAEDILKLCNLPLKWVASGSFRDVYKIVGAPHVIKVPIGKDGKRHAAQEHRALVRLKTHRHFARLWSKLPRIDYYEPSTGLILMPFYKAVSPRPKNLELMNQIEDLVVILVNTHPDLGDEKWDNYGWDDEGNLRIVDLGRFQRNGV